ncbi:inter-alpha-trypsin inhibitor heavy chain H3-like [Antennarius striatus]|uniref:inter-alpha-trypsin inhibitor heavy chain H3-like n=1 Tax=Antennarius striatus TaxID=241820 RepID=UPI0035B0186E
MSGLQHLRLLLLWGSACLWLPYLAQGALVISGPRNSFQEKSGSQSMRQKRSTSNLVEVQSVVVDCTVTSRFAHSVMTTEALNLATVSQEIFFEVDLPKTAFISNFSMEIEGQVYVGEVKEKETAKKEYETAVSSGQTAGLVKVSGRKMEKFSVSVNIAGNSGVIFSLTYEELLERKLGQYEILVRVKPKQVVNKFQILANIYEPQGIAYVNIQSTFLTNDLLLLVQKTVSEKEAHISFSPTMEQQKKCPDCDGTIIDGDFIIKYDVKRSADLGEIQVVNGYFVHFFAPPNLPRVPKNVVFVIDRSGSMYGRKIEQTREAMLLILDDLNEDDSFSIVQFDHNIDVWKPSLTRATTGNVADAKIYVRNIRDNGGTDINGGVLRAVEMLASDRKSGLLQDRSIDMIILLTDGMPNSGVWHLPKIQENVRNAIGGNMSLFCLGFGNDVDYSFLDTMSRQNKGLARRIFEGSDAALQLKGFYQEVSSPLLSEVELRYPDNAVESVTTTRFDKLFDGSEIVVAGHLLDSNLDSFLAEVYGRGSVQDFQVQGQATTLDWNVLYPDESYIFGKFMERLWAYLSIQQLLEKSKSGTPEEKANAKADALDMSLRYSFVTPLTSMVVTKPEDKEHGDDPLIADKLTEEERQEAERHASIHGSYPPSSSGSPSPTYFVDSDPHFMIELPDKNDALCFNVNDKPGTIYNLVKDTTLGILVNGQTIGDKMIPPDGTINTYLGRFGIVHNILGVKLEVTTTTISVYQDKNWMKFLWSDAASVKGKNVDLVLHKDHSLKVTLKDSVKFVILLHKVWEKHPYHRDYLGFYTLDTHLLSPSVHGLLGQFYHGIEYEVTDLREGETPEKPDATMFVKGLELNVTRGWQRDFRRDWKNGEKIACWFVHNNGTGLVDGDATDYIVSGLFKTV